MEIRDYGYSGLLLSDAEYQLIKPTPQKCDAPLFPGPLIIQGTRSQVTAFTEDIPTVPQYLFENYGRVPTEKVKEKEIDN